MNEVYTLLVLFLVMGTFGYKLLENVLESPIAFLISMIVTILVCFGLIKFKEGITFDTNFANLIMDGNTSVGANNYEDSGYNANRAFFRFRDLNMKSGRAYGTVSG